ncbi:MAG TPA: hypothetical protein VGQ06_07245 [Gemmatimonadales bacterium]|nr:hypothetical protein [Gemmatimonadales bacterium]
MAVTRASLERRVTVDRRRGAERRSTMDRRGQRNLSVEAPGEHLRNALQLIIQLSQVETLDEDQRADVAVVLQRVQRALDLLERRTGLPASPPEA